MNIILFWIQFAALIWLGFSVVYVLIYALSGHFYYESVNQSQQVSQKTLPKMVVLIPAYKEDNVIIQVAKSALNHAYNGPKDIVVIADQLKTETLHTLRNMQLILIEVNFKKSTKAKALNFAMQQISSEYKIAVVLDADNIMDKNVLNNFAVDYLTGKMAIQGRRTAKNVDTNFAFLDGISEGINNHIYSKGANALNLSSRLVGSGMAFDYNCFKVLMSRINAIGGFDKELELALIERGVKIFYQNRSVIFDEKVSKSADFERQRTRWISAQYQFLWKKLPQAFMGLFKGNFDYFYKTMQLALPPRILMPFFILIICLSSFLVGFEQLGLSALILLFLNVIAYTIAIPANYWNKNMLIALISLPKALLITLKCLFKLNKAKKTFMHTPHGNVE